MTNIAARQWLWPVAVAIVALVIGLCAGLAFDTESGDSVATPVGGEVDIGFAQDMSAHHQQAVRMCDMVPLDASADVRGLVGQIRAAQWREIGQMMGWLQMLDAPLQAAHPMSWMRDGGSHDHAGASGMMPGTADGDELTALQAATGSAGEVLFLQLMIRHHQGGIDMAGQASRTVSNPEIRRAAVGMVKNQSDEIAVMTVMLDQRGGQALPYPTSR
jgi:uncharacterized protein (DUF305 family)